MPRKLPLLLLALSATVVLAATPRVPSDAEARLMDRFAKAISGHDTLAVSSGDDNHCLFLITQTSQLDGARRILHEATIFFVSYGVNETVEIKFPLDDLKACYNLQAWRFPASFPESDLKNWEMGFDTHKQEYVKRPYSQPGLASGGARSANSPSATLP